MINPDLLSFYGWWQFSTCLFAFLGLIGIWYHLGRKKGDFGQIWLALSILCWCISGLVEIYFSDAIEKNETSNLYLGGWRSIFSLLILTTSPTVPYSMTTPTPSPRHWALNDKTSSVQPSIPWPLIPR